MINNFFLRMRGNLFSIGVGLVLVMIGLFKVLQVKGLFDQINSVKVVAPELILFDSFGNQFIPEIER